MALITIYTATLKGCLKHYFIKDEAEAAESGIEEDERLDVGAMKIPSDSEQWVQGTLWGCMHQCCSVMTEICCSSQMTMTRPLTAVGC